MLDRRSAGKGNQEHFRKDPKKSGSERHSGSFSVAGHRTVTKHNIQHLIYSKIRSFWVPGYKLFNFKARMAGNMGDCAIHIENSWPCLNLLNWNNAVKVIILA